jgi:hypothetical protein
MVGNLGRMALLTKVGVANAIPKKAEKYLAIDQYMALICRHSSRVTEVHNIIILLFLNLFTATYFSFTFAD